MVSGWSWTKISWIFNWETKLYFFPSIFRQYSAILPIPSLFPSLKSFRHPTFLSDTFEKNGGKIWHMDTMATDDHSVHVSKFFLRHFDNFFPPFSTFFPPFFYLLFSDIFKLFSAILYLFRTLLGKMAENLIHGLMCINKTNLRILHYTIYKMIWVAGGWSRIKI